MADARDHDAHPIVFDPCDNAIVTNAILPEPFEIFALQRFAKRTRIGRWGYSLIKKAQDSSSGLTIETRDIGIGAAIELNRPCHIAS